MKTAMQLFIEAILSGKITGALINSDYYLELEKQQIIDAAKEGANYDNSKFCSPEDYYLKTYKTN